MATAMLGILCSNANGQLQKAEELQKALATSNKDTVAWSYGGFINIGMNEGFLHNWAAGGELASFIVNGIFSGHIDRLYRRDIWSNNLDMTYGLNYTYSSSFKPHKTDDRIDFTSKYGHRIDKGKNMYFTSLLNFKSQFTKGYNYDAEGWENKATSRFLSPAYITLAVGTEYRKGSDISVFLSPLAGRLTLVDTVFTNRSPQGAFGVPKGKNNRYELGAYFSGRYIKNINKNIRYKGRLDLYSNYLAKNTTDSMGNIIKRDNPGNIAVLFDNLFTIKISKYVTTAFGATFIYDHNFPYSKTTVNSAGATVPKNEPGEDLGWMQVKQLFTFGIEYKF